MSKTNTKRSFFPSDSHQITEPAANSNTRQRVSKPKPTLQGQNANQRAYIRKLSKRSHDIFLAIGPAGSGKTYVAVVYALMEYLAGRCDKIIITRPNVGAGDDLGFLPGTLIDKMSAWVMPILDILKEFLEVHEIELMLRREELEMAPLCFQRGRTYKNAIVILDEGQNSTVEQMKMIMTRIGENCQMIITGDMEQHDRGEGISGLAHIVERLERKRREVDLDEDANDADRIGIFRFGRQDVVRHPVIEQVLALYDD